MGRGQQKSFYLLETDSEILTDEIMCVQNGLQSNRHVWCVCGGESR